MQLRWWIGVDGTKILQYKTNEDNGGEYYWRDVDVELEVEKEYAEQGKLRDRIRELENDYKALVEARK